MNAAPSIDMFRPDRPEGAGVEALPDDVNQPGGYDRLFFGASPVLSQIYRMAVVENLGPWALMGNLIARVLSMTSPALVLPGYKSSCASLNFGLVVPGLPGHGKSTSATAAESVRIVVEGGVLRPQTEVRTNIGSGEGLASMFTMIDAHDGPEDDDGNATSIDRQPRVERAWFCVDEGSIFSKSAGRQGSTTLGYVTGALTGGAMGNTTKDNDLVVEKGSYRFCLTIATQMAHTGVFFEGEDTGLGQRFLWVDPTIDIVTARKPVLSSALDGLGADYVDDGRNKRSLTGRKRVQVELHIPGPAAVYATHEAGKCLLSEDNEHSTVMAVDHRIGQLIEHENFEMQSSRRDPEASVDSHRRLVQLKVSAAIALMHNRLEISPNDFALAEIMMLHSAAVREHCRDFGRTREIDALAGKQLLREQATREVSSKSVTERRKTLLDTISRQGYADPTWYNSGSGYKRSDGSTQRRDGRIATDQLAAEGRIMAHPDGRLVVPEALGFTSEQYKPIAAYLADAQFGCPEVIDEVIESVIGLFNLSVQGACIAIRGFANAAGLTTMETWDKTLLNQACKIVIPPAPAASQASRSLTT